VLVVSFLAIHPNWQLKATLLQRGS